MTWRVAPCLATLLAQVNAAYPQRDHASDGTIGDAAHQAEGGPTYNREGYGISGSDHDPDNNGYVCALDIDSGPGIDIEQVVAGLTTNPPDPRVSYVIWNRRIFSSRSGSDAWAWRPYGGSDPHTNHVHVSVRHLINFVVNAATWNIGSSTPQPQPAPEDDMPIIVTSGTTSYISFGAGLKPIPGGGDTYKALKAAGIREVHVSDLDIAAWK